VRPSVAVVGKLRPVGCDNLRSNTKLFQVIAPEM
jgi:hypothetical protein